MPKARQKIAPFLWYVKEAEQAAKLYTSIFPDSGIDGVWSLPVDSPSGPAGSVKVVDFHLFGRRFQAMSAGPMNKFNYAVSFVVFCDTQAELDKYWNAILKSGGKASQCGWIEDKFGLQWQITPTALGEMMTSRDRQAAGRAAAAMLTMVKLDIAELEAAYAGDSTKIERPRRSAARKRTPAKRTRTKSRRRTA